MKLWARSAFETEFLNEGFSFSDLENGWAITGHDPVVAIDHALAKRLIRTAPQHEPTLTRTHCAR